MEINENAPGNVSQQGVGGVTDNETAQDSKGDKPKASLPPNKMPIDEEMADVNATNAVSSEHPEP